MSAVKSTRRSLHGQEFGFSVGDLVLVKWHDGMVYFAKIKKIDIKKRKCTVVFDDKSQDEACFNQIHSVDETTTDIICIKCKKDDSENPNEIVLCDSCGIGYHQKCHTPLIPTSALTPSTPWQCTYCVHGEKCPYLTESLDVLQNLLSDDCRSSSDTEPPVEIRSTRKSRRTAEGKHSKIDSEPQVSKSTSPSNERKQSHLSNVDAIRHKLASVSPNEKNNQYINPPDSYRAPDENIYEPIPEPIKRRKKHVYHKKKHNRSSVDTCTLSVTRLPLDTTNGLATSDKETAVQIDNVPVLERRPRSLRVSVSLQDDSDGVVKVKTPLSVKTMCENEKTAIFPTVTLKSLEKKDKVSTESSSKPVEPFPIFTASPLPTSSSSNFLPDFNSITDMFELSSTSENNILKTSILAGSKVTEGIEPMDTTSQDDEISASSDNITSNKVFPVKKIPSPVLTETLVSNKSSLVSKKSPAESNKISPVSIEAPPVSNGMLPGNKKSPSMSNKTPPVSDGVPHVLSNKSSPPRSKETPPVSRKSSPLNNEVPSMLSNKSPLVSNKSPPVLNNKSPPMNNRTPPSTVIKLITPPITTHAHSHVKSPPPTSSLPSKLNTVHSKVWMVPVLSDKVPAQPSSVPVISPATKRPLQDDVIITSVEKNLPPPQTKKPRLESPVQSKPDQINKDISHPHTTGTTTLPSYPHTTPTTLRPATYATILTPSSHPHTISSSVVTPPSRPHTISSSVVTLSSRPHTMPTSVLAPSSSPHTMPTSILTPPSHPHTAHTTVLPHSLEAPHPPKLQYVYCVQSSGQPVYIPAAMHPQALGKHTSKTSPSHLTGYDVAPVNTTKPYAIVNALPSSVGMNMFPRKIMSVPSAGESPVIIENPHVNVLEKQAVRSPVSTQVLNTKPPVDHKVQLSSKKKTNNTKEDYLLSNFDDAWKKLQANGQCYKTMPKPSPGIPMSKPRPRIPPNAEVVPGAGYMTSRLSMVRPVGQRSRTLTPKVHRVCSRCGSDATYLCSGCRTEWYCGRECQLKSWDSHSEACKN